MLDAFSDGGYQLMLVPLISAGVLVGVGQILWSVLRHDREAEPATAVWVLVGGIGGALAIWVAIGLMLSFAGEALDG